MWNRIGKNRNNNKMFKKVRKKRVRIENTSSKEEELKRKRKL